MISVTRRVFCAAPAILKGLSRSKPNLLLLMADQHRGDCFGADGNAAAHTPVLDRLAADGIRFRHAYSSTPTCTPARSALLTGCSPWGHGMLGYGRVADSYPVELPAEIRKLGYQTLGIGKMHWSHQRNLHGFHRTILDESGRVESPGFISDYRAWFATEAPNLNPDATGVGFNDYTGVPFKLPERLHPTRWTADVATRFIDGYAGADPFFLKVSFARPHSPYDPPQRWWDFFANRELPKPRVAPWAEKYATRNSSRADIWHGRLSDEETRLARTGYYGSVSFVDEQVGRIVESLEKRKILDETLIVYISDHGDMTGDHNLWRKSYAYEPSARIPMIVRGPGAPRGKVEIAPAEIRDVLPTFVEAAGGAVPKVVEGQNLLRLKRDWIDLEHDICYDASNHWNALTDGRSKYIFHAQTGREQFFDLEKDPMELNDLAGSSPETTRWRARMVAHLAARGEQWIRGGELVTRPQRQLYSPNYPKPQLPALR
ncbi:MAG TPA: arylsulfatase [Bryobacteraceae bacterium]|nr:arylsulfatase [Bryobacteraceae bacterium]HPT29233.1 arylsulfatase [Bryobacteraceae bacterium]